MDLIKQFAGDVPETPYQEEETPDSPISSISSRKLWYRLTRPETLREFNLGNDDKSYTRVTWQKSEVRAMEVTNAGSHSHDPW